MPATLPDPPTPASILALIQSIAHHPPGAPAALAFRSTLRRKGQDHAGGPAALADVVAWIRAADPDRADAREAVITAAWVDLLPKPEDA
ncbi:hypothetical protein [Methylobacterium sp. E-046]|uniref:hypothetical protein n=1 Tax=Methylobacterium sp. E-046 TaxID=2836576 RepID=UPI001FBB0247|nr:hypothetical protein [Methylobacterium sp. E-046]MCJ2102395.1 hypothetical protein [Methylobacterium sp. E-046]